MPGSASATSAPASRSPPTSGRRRSTRPSGRTDLTVAEVFGLVDPALGWDDLEQLASECELPVLVKGLVTSEDAALAVEHGAAGVVVSNHGGRQLDAAPATIDALPEVVDAVEGRIPVLMDGGIRRGSDVAVALALGRRRGARGEGLPLGPGGRRPGRSRARPRDAPRRAAAHAGAAGLRVALGADDRTCAPPVSRRDRGYSAAPMKDRLSSSDMSSLFAERGQIHVHVGGIIIAEGAPPSYDELVDHVENRLNLVPRFRQRIVKVPARDREPDLGRRDELRHPPPRPERRGPAPRPPSTSCAT